MTSPPGPYVVSAAAVTVFVLLARWVATPTRSRRRGSDTPPPPPAPEQDRVTTPLGPPLWENRYLRETDAQLQRYWNLLRPLYPQAHDAGERSFHRL
ncbi:hypothetical protein RKD23_000578 [Streptomyces sp. SAI-170]|uniref:hypothetical protein n=1 Tax=Streptomyces sp. SAI-170 TaxID=3377729 RepID=UPI003C7DDC4B